MNDEDELDGLVPPIAAITILWSDDEGCWTVDLGSLTHWEAKGVVRDVLRELDRRDPSSMRVRQYGADIEEELE